MSKRLAITCLAILAIGHGWDACAAEETTLANVRLDVQMTRVSVADSLTLVPALRDAKTASTGYGRLQEMLANGQAALIDWPVVWLRTAVVQKRARTADEPDPAPTPFGGNRSVSENIEECRYPTEFEPPLEPQTFGVQPSGPRLPVRPTWEVLKPKAYETRNVGASVEAEVWVEEPDRSIFINLVANVIQRPEFQKWVKQASPIGIVGTVVTANFTSSKVLSSLRVIHDRPALVSVVVVPKPEPHVELCILRARITVLPREAVTLPLPETIGFEVFDRSPFPGKPPATRSE